ncbi:MAG: PPOX class F420-dependent oxidoreductase [Anaerolineae bacterium]
MPNHADAEVASIPKDFEDLFEARSLGHLATVMPDGSPQVTPVWIDYDGTHLIVNSAKGRVKSDNMLERPEVAIEVMDGTEPYRYLAVRGDVVEIIDGDEAEAHIDKLAHKYLGVSKYPSANRAPGEERVMFKIAPRSVHGFASRRR